MRTFQLERKIWGKMKGEEYQNIGKIIEENGIKREKNLRVQRAREVRSEGRRD